MEQGFVAVRVLGVDGCRGGWVAVALEDGEYRELRVARSTIELVDDDAVVMGIDMPMGETTPGARASEAAARRYLGHRHRTIFTPPPLAAAVDDYSRARSTAIATTGKSISKQAWHLLPKMRDVAERWAREPLRFREAHPECSFATMAGAPLHSSKKTHAGLAERRALLERHGVHVPDERMNGAHPDDVLDAAAAAWTAHRVATGAAFSLPDPPELDGAGRPVAVWC
jgi:predicted RNase H-like nuclease